ncbi:MAG: TolC family protein [Terriglobia bacterium]
MRFCIARRFAALFVAILFSAAATSYGQARQPAPPEANGLRAAPESRTATPLARLIEEAEHANPSISAAQQAWRAAKQVPSQVSTLPDPQLVVQQFAVGSPRPFAGFSNSNFAYVGFGISQDLPYPGKLRLRGRIAERSAGAAEEKIDAVGREVDEQVRSTYFRLGEVQETLGIEQRDRKLLNEIEKIAEARYRVGQGGQQEVLKAQLEQTRILADLAEQQREKSSLEARLKQLLNRAPESLDLTARPLTETPLRWTADELLHAVAAGNPDARMQQEIVRRQDVEVALARSDFYPDFNVQCMWQHTASQFRDYYMLSFGVRVPLYRKRRQDPELAERLDDLASSRQQYEAAVQQDYFSVRDAFLDARTDDQVLKIYREGLIPQATAGLNAGLAAYQQSREDFETLINSFLDVLHLDEEYWRALADHETALARLEALTGLKVFH